MPTLFSSHPALAAFVFCCRLTDVSLGTLRTILVVRGHRSWAATLGFFEVLIWLGAASTVLQHLDTWYLAVAYAAGFASGNVVGIWIEQRLAIGHLLVRALSTAGPHLATALREAGYHVVELSGRSGQDEPAEVLFLVERRRRVPELLRRIETIDPDAVCTVADVKEHRTGAVPGRSGWRWLAGSKRK